MADKTNDIMVNNKDNARTMNERSLKNLELGRWKKGQSGNPNGKPKLFKNIIEGLPVEAKAEIYKILHYVISLPSEAEVKRLSDNTSELGEYGLVIQIACKELLSKSNGWRVLNDILNRLFGMPRQSAELMHKGTELKIIVKDEETADRIRKL